MLFGHVYVRKTYTLVFLEFQVDVGWEKGIERVDNPDRGIELGASPCLPLRTGTYRR